MILDSQLNMLYFSIFHFLTIRMCPSVIATASLALTQSTHSIILIFFLELIPIFHTKISCE